LLPPLVALFSRFGGVPLATPSAAPAAGGISGVVSDAPGAMPAAALASPMRVNSMDADVVRK
jgi:hypothetical protein